MRGDPHVDLSQFRVRFPSDLYPYKGSHVIEVCFADQIPPDNEGWQHISEAGSFFQGKFAEKNPFNFPGPFYGALTDTCETGPMEAPANVMLDSQGQEFLFRQPATMNELRQVISAALCDPFQG